MEQSSSEIIAKPDDHAFIDAIFSWSLEDIFNENLFKVEKIPESFVSVQRYLDSYVLPLLEETRAQLRSSMDIVARAPYASAISLSECKLDGKLVYDVTVDCWRNRFSDCGKHPYMTLPGDIVILTDAEPKTISDFRSTGRAWTLALVTDIKDNTDGSAIKSGYRVKASKDVEFSNAINKSWFMIFLINITTNKRIWNALQAFRNLNFIKEILCANSLVAEKCSYCFMQRDGIFDERFVNKLSSKLNESQNEAVAACLDKMQCNHKSSVELIWGPAGTGKTYTVSMLLFGLLRMKVRSLTCAPTTVAVIEVASRVLKLVTESCETDSGTHAPDIFLGDLLFFGNEEGRKVNSGIEEICLDYRVQRLLECFGPESGWCHCFTYAIDFFEDCASQYFREQGRSHENEKKDEKSLLARDDMIGECKSFLEFVRESFRSTASPLKKCLYVLRTHIPESYILKQNIKNILGLVGLLDSFETLLFCNDISSEELEKLFSYPELVEESSKDFPDILLLLCLRRRECLSLLKTLHNCLSELNLPTSMEKDPIEEFCLRTASLIFCTSSNSYRLHSLAISPLNFLVIDEATQLKECETAIPLQLPGIMHTILIGDECQLPAMVESRVSSEAGFGRSLFERLSLLGHPKHILKLQYRMHPSISCFPNSNFYLNKMYDAPNVIVEGRNYKNRYLPGPMFGPYSFINIFGGREELDDVGHSRRNMVEVAIVWKLVQIVYKAWKGSKQKLRIGIISPYTAQVVAIEEKLGQKYENIDGFSVKVESVDGFQGGEADIVIISTVRSNTGGAIRFMSNSRRINFALTRARQRLWILGNERTLCQSGCDWEVLVHDAKKRRCFFNADEDKELARTILEVQKEFDQLDDLLHGDSVLLRCAIWKVHFSEYFRKSFGKLASRIKTYVLNFLLKLASGWRPKRRTVELICERSSQILKQFKVEGLYIICSIDIDKEKRYTQVLKFWDILPLEDIPGLLERLDGIFETYTDDFIRRCKEISVEGYKNAGAFDGRCFMENSKVSESLLLMKFYSLSSGAVKHLLSDSDGRELILPFVVTDEERNIILFQKSTFILGRSGTGKTTVLTMKLTKKEQLHHIATEGFGDIYGNTLEDACWRNNFYDGIDLVEGGVGEAKKSFLRQLFVTVSPRLCYAVKQHVSQLISFASGGKYSSGSSSAIEDIDDTALFQGIPDSFVDIPHKSYPLVITLSKFLTMLDLTIGKSYFERFPSVRPFLHREMGNSPSISLLTFIQTREVDFKKFLSFYWPHFDSRLTKKLDPSRVFTEIMSHIKGGLRAWESCNGRLSQEDYVELSCRLSTLSIQEKETVYNIFKAYESKKAKNGDFDMADLVIDLHDRLKKERYDGDMMDYVYIDEVQDLSISQIALFKFICKNVIEGFVFAGDTAQTIAKGVDFRFEDIRSLFYKEFLPASRSGEKDRRNKEGQLSKILQLSQNFRTHAGVLKLAQSVLDLLYLFFPSLIDILSHETSLVSGEAPVIVAENCEKAIETIFRGNANEKCNFVGFGAEQVILVRDDQTRNKIYSYVGKKALVLTILECKGLEFQDVLLYNFFGSQDLRGKWGVVYEYMKEHEIPYSSSSRSFRIPSFDLAKHYLLCSELKQLYVAITRTRQRLWICDEDFSNPMFDYWRKKEIVQVRQLDDSMVQGMQVVSSLEEWKSQGYKFLHERNYDMAIICFERAGDRHAQKLAEALSLKASADRMHGSNPKMALVAHMQAAEMFESIGKAESAAECFYLSNNYERAGRSYLQCGESSVKRAAECFYLAGCYKLAAELYASGNHFSMCLTACTKGELFEMGLQYIHGWKQHLFINDYRNRIAQEFLESCVVHYHKLGEKIIMMRYVRHIDSMDSIRKILKKFGYLDELLSLEAEAGNFLEAANIANIKGELLLEADLLEKAEHFEDASMLLLWYVFLRSLWSVGNRGWPLKHFAEKEKLLSKARSLAKNASRRLCEIVNTEAEILMNEQSSLSMMKQHLTDSQRHESIRGEILSARKILDVYLDLDVSKYWQQNDLVHHQAGFWKDKSSENRVSVETLVSSWNFWKNKILHIFEYLRCLPAQDTSKYRSYGEFCFSYLGVRKQISTNVYLLLNSDAYWVRVLESRFVRERKLVSVDVRQLVFAAQSYWRSELLSVGMNMLVKLKELYDSSTCALSLFSQSTCLVHIYEVAKFLLSSNCLNHESCDNKKLQNFIRVSPQHLFSCIFPVDWRESLDVKTISLRRSQISGNLLEVIFESVIFKDKLSYEQLGRMAVIILGSGDSGCMFHNFYERIKDRVAWNPTWKAFIEALCRNAGGLSYVWKLHGALADAYIANWRKEDYISPGCFLYLVEHQLILLSCFQGYFITTMSSFLEWLHHQEWSVDSLTSVAEHAPQSTDGILEFLAHVVQQFLHNMKRTMEWTRKSYKNVKHFDAVVLRLVVTICLIYLNFGLCGDVLFDLLGRKYITERLPWEFYDALCGIQKHNSLEFNVHVLYGAFKKIGNRLVIVSLGVDCSRYLCPNAVFVNMSDSRCNLWSVLFSKINEAVPDCTEAAKVDIPCSFTGILTRDNCDQGKRPDLLSSDISSVTDWSSNKSEIDESNRTLITQRLWEIFKTLTSNNHGEEKSILPQVLKNDITVKRDIERSIHLLSTVIEGCSQKSPPDDENKTLFEEADSMLDDLRRLYVAIEMSKLGLQNDISRIEGLLKKLQSRRPRIKPLLNWIFLPQDENLKRVASETKIYLDSQCDKEDIDIENGKRHSRRRKSCVW